MSYHPLKHGRAEYGNWMEIPQSTISGIQEETDTSLPLSAQKFASFSYIVNDTVIDPSSFPLSGIYVLDASDLYSRVIQEDLAGNVYIAHAPIGSAVSGSVWRAQKIDSDGSKSWADSGLFTQQAIALSGLAYNY